MLFRPFELFDAPLTDSSDYIGAWHCHVCGKNAEHCFMLSVGAGAFLPCSNCGQAAAVESWPSSSLRCRLCATVAAGPSLPNQAVCCAACLREGRASMMKDTEIGMVTWETAAQGWAHGPPGLDANEWNVSASRAEGWAQVRVASEHLFKLVTTPTYATMQGERWLFCCHQPMVFFGTWTRSRFSAEAGDGRGEQLLEDYLARRVPGLWAGDLEDDSGIYVFRCSICERRRAHWDVA